MPITAKLSRQFYEKPGDEVANELVGWLNAVDESYRDEFRGLFESNFGRVEARLREMDARVDAKLDRLELRLGRQIEEFRSGTTVSLQRLETRLIRWMFGFWIGAWIALAGTLIALQRLR
jgi:hypothetical protein